MTRLRFAAALLLTGPLLVGSGSGCAREPRGGGPIDVRAPGVRVQVGRDGATSVRAPGVGVQAGPEAVEVVTPRY